MMVRTGIFGVARLGSIGLLACLTLAGCRGCSQTSAVPTPAAGEPVVVQVGGGKEAIRDLGVVALGSRHVVVFVVDNPTDQPLVFKSVRGDCECITPENPPAKIEANGSARVTAVYVAPKTPMVYESRLLIATDNPNRHVISLRVRSSPPVSGADSPVSHPVGTQRGD